MTKTTVSVLAVGALGAEAPSFRVRTRLPSAELGNYGVAMRHRPLFTAKQDRLFHEAGTARRIEVLLSARTRLRRQLAAGADWDVTLIQRQVDLLPGLGLERRATGDRRLVLDVDDAIWLDHRFGEAGGHRLAVLKGTSRKVRWLATRADVVIAGNDLLGDWLSRYSRRVAVVPSVVEHRDVAPRVHQPRDRLVVGWIGSASTAPLLGRVVEPLRRFAAAAPDLEIEFLVVGGCAPGVPGLRVRSERWSEEREHEFIAGGADQWVEHLVTLAREPRLRARLGAAGRLRVQKDFSVERWAPRLASLLRGESSTCA